MQPKARSWMHVPIKQGEGIPIFYTCGDEHSPHSALILIHEVWGLNDHIKDIAERLCREGFEVIAPDLIEGTELEKVVKPELAEVMFDQHRRPKYQTQIRAMMAPLSSPEFALATTEKLQACFNYLSSKPAVSKIGVIGFCLGGTYAYSMAVSQPGLSAAVAFYGHADYSQKQLAQINCPVLAFYGENDHNLVDKLPELEVKMKRAKRHFTYKIYPDAGHAFFNDTNQLTYNQKAAKDAWRRALAFLRANLQ